MNLKYLYYRKYFDGIIQIAPPEKGSPAEKNIEAIFRDKNRQLTSTKGVLPFQPTHFHNIGTFQELKLQVQNPGLLPGIGYPHEVGYPGEFKLGFGFDHITGLPVLPGSSVKGVLRSVFPQFKFDAEQPQHFQEDDKKEENKKLQEEKAKYIVGLLRRLKLNVPAETELEKIKKLAHQLDLAIFCGFNFEKAEKTTRLPMSKHDVFFDALPVSFKENQLLGRDALTPHTSGPLKNPIPLPFLKVMADVIFGFYFRLQDSKIGELMTITAEHKRRMFAEILCTVGAGAKTNVGYGQFEAVNADDRIPKSVKKANTTSDANLKPAGASPILTPFLSPAKPTYLRGTLKGGAEVDAELLVGGNPGKFKLFIRADYEPTVEVRYPAGFKTEDVGRLATIRVKNVSGKGVVVAVEFVRFK